MPPRYKYSTRCNTFFEVFIRRQTYQTNWLFRNKKPVIVVVLWRRVSPRNVYFSCKPFCKCFGFLLNLSFTMKKLVFVSSIQVFPPMSGGQLRSANLCRALAKLGYDVSIYSLTGRKEQYLNQTQSFQQDVEPGVTEFVNMNPLFGFVQFLFYRLNLPPLWVTWILKVLIPMELRKLLSDSELVVLDFPFLHPLFKKIKAEKWLNTHNAEFELWKSPFVASWVKRVELSALAQADKVLFCSEKDLEVFLNLTPEIKSKSSIVSNGVNLAKYQTDPALRIQVRQQWNAENKKVFLFTGSSYEPNREAFAFLKRFCAENRNALKELNVLVLVAGTVSIEKIEEDHFKVLGRVEDLIPYFAASDFGLNPVTEGSGMNVKMIEYMAAGLPLVSTSFGCRGLDLTHGESVFTFERQNLLEAIRNVTCLSVERRQQLTLNAFNQNENRIDMMKALQMTGLKL
ncbi:glycosyltransferase family 4 protein [Bdellovibrio reynosensis]|uniref:Glycosyltransferase family 4 protein n=1 Tax=Bdellovibrio reynosensis TaxID=2835041 RepID=A0ABY4CE75_9BACT|nr:glycosyltransferase family 4 protein [Bdellovibrio reynosensis]UOF01843.1 glycosyltransferase family 4 protein [Bdellovibrio reynosensis]